MSAAEDPSWIHDERMRKEGEEGNGEGVEEGEEGESEGGEESEDEVCLNDVESDGEPPNPHWWLDGPYIAPRNRML